MGGINMLRLNIIGEQFRQEDQMPTSIAYTLMDAIEVITDLCTIGKSMSFIGAKGLSYTTLDGCDRLSRQFFQDNHLPLHCHQSTY